jgi:type VI secretion system secreted protein Hcp
MPIYMKIADIPGEVEAEGFAKTIGVNSFQYGIGLAVESANAGSGSGKRSQGAASFSEIVVTKTLDNASGKFFDHVSGGIAIPKIEFFFTKATSADKAGNAVYYTVTIEDVFVSGVSLSSGGDMPSESISLNYSKIKTNYMTEDDMGKQAQGTLSGWDLSKNKAYA